MIVRIILLVVGFFCLMAQLSQFLILLIMVIEIDPKLLTAPTTIVDFQAPVTIVDFKLMWLYIGSFFLAGVALGFAFIDFSFLRFRFVKIDLYVSVFYIVLTLFWTLLGLTSYLSAESAFFSSFSDAFQLNVLLGGVASVVMLLLLFMKCYPNTGSGLAK